MKFTDKAFLVGVVPRLAETPKEKLQDAQAISEAVLDAEVRIGQLMRDVPKASHDRGNQYTGGKDPAVGRSQNKRQVIEASGFTQTQAQRFEALAAHPEIVEQAKTEARENDDIAAFCVQYSLHATNYSFSFWRVQAEKLSVKLRELGPQPVFWTCITLPTIDIIPVERRKVIKNQ